MRGINLVSLIVVCLSILLTTSVVHAADPIPNVLILFNNDNLATSAAYNGSNNYDNSKEYWGYFDHLKEYEYQGNTGFVPVSWVGADHYTSNADRWSGNFLNWVTMAHIDLVRKTLTGGKRSSDANSKTVLSRAEINPAFAVKKQYHGADLQNLVPAIYADPSVSFSNSGTILTVLDSSQSPVSPDMDVKVTVCDPAMPESNCTIYPNGIKPEGLLQRYHDRFNFGLMSHTVAQPTEGGVLRVPIGSVTGEVSQTSGQLASGKGMINIINNIDLSRAWSPVAEIYYEALRYLKGNEAGQEAYCGTSGMLAEDGFNVYGCDSRRMWSDPITDPCQRTIIITLTDEYPSNDVNSLPGSSIYPGYLDTPMNFGANTPYNPDVSMLTNLVGDAEGITGSNYVVGNVIGNANNLCTAKTITNLSDTYGICPSEPAAQGAFYTSGLTFEAFTGDLRPDLPGRQNVESYFVVYKASPGGYAYPDPPMNPLWLAAKYGNFLDSDYSGLPDTDSEWMKSAELCAIYPGTANCQPRGFSYAESGSAIEKAITEAFYSVDLGDDGICDNVGDSDSDGIVDQDDICPFDPENDIDGDSICGDIDICPNDSLNDSDGDGVCGNLDVCPLIDNPGQEDADGDGVGDGVGDACTSINAFWLAVAPNSTAYGTVWVSWGASNTPGASYVLEEDTDAGFGNPSIVYTGSALSMGLPGKADGLTYYYRIKTSAPDYADSPWRLAANGSLVNKPSTSSAWLAVAPNSTTYGTVWVSWGVSNTPGASYVLEEDTNAGFGNPSIVYTGSALSVGLPGKADGLTYYYRIKTSAPDYGDSTWRLAASGSLVNKPSTSSAWLAVAPNSTTYGTVWVGWGVSNTPGASYVLEEDTDVGFENPSNVYTGSALSVGLPGRTDGLTYYYRVKTSAPDYGDSTWRLAASGCLVANQ
jgi:hypothetical protein